MKKSIRHLIDQIEVVDIYGSRNKDVLDVVDDSRNVNKGCLFVAIKGITVDAHEFIEEVIKKGAVAIIGEVKPKKKWLQKVTYIQVKNSRQALSMVASAWFNHPTAKTKMVGVTGSDGKTTTCYLIHQILQEAGHKVGIITSVNAKIGIKEIETGLHVTNPEPLLLQKIIFDMVKENVDYIVLEVTSHGIDQDRVFGIQFEFSVLTDKTPSKKNTHTSLLLWNNN